MDLEVVMRQWRELFGTAQVDDANQAQARYGRDTSGSHRRLLGALRASKREDVVTLMRDCLQLNIAVHPISTGKNWGYGSALPAAHDCLLLDLSGMTNLSFDEENGVVTVEPGVTQAQLARFLDEDATGPHPYLVPVTGAGPSTSLLGNALERGYGVTPIVDHFAAVTDIEAVLADGSVYRGMLHEAAGPELARLFRWGLGPFTMGLFTQSGFGIVTRMSILLARRPESISVGLFGIPDENQLGLAVEAIRDIVQQLPGVVGAVNLMNAHRVLSMSAPYPGQSLNSHGLIPDEVVRAMGRDYQVMAWTGFCTLYGKKSIVRAAQREIKFRLRGLAKRLMFVTPQRAETLHALSKILPGKMGQRLQSLTGTLRKSLDLVSGRPNETALPLAYWRSPHTAKSAPLNPAEDGCGLLWYAPLVPMRPSAAKRYVEMIRGTTPRHGIEPLVTFTTLGDRLFDSTVPILFDPEKPNARDQAWECYLSLLREGAKEGFFPYRVPIDAMPYLREFAPAATAFNDRLARAFDPDRRLAPGRYY